MLGYTARRLLFGSLPVVWLIATITFVLLNATPGGPWDGDRPRTATTIANLDRAAGLDAPLPERYGRYLGDLLRGDLGPSLTRPGQSVAGLLRDRAGASALLAAVALALGVPLGLALGVAAARRPGGPWDRLTLVFGLAGSALPAFVIGIGAIAIFSLWLDWLPPSGWGEPRHVVLPALAMAVLPAAVLARLTRAVVAEALQADYVRTAAAMGIAPGSILRHQIFPNVAPAPLTLLGVLIADLAAGSFLVEFVFGVPGLGRLFVDAVFQRDYGVVLGVTLFYAGLVAGLTLTADLLHAALDPRLRQRLLNRQATW